MSYAASTLASFEAARPQVFEAAVKSIQTGNEIYIAIGYGMSLVLEVAKRCLQEQIDIVVDPDAFYKRHTILPEEERVFRINGVVDHELLAKLPGLHGYNISLTANPKGWKEKRVAELARKIERMSERLAEWPECCDTKEFLYDLPRPSYRVIPCSDFSKIKNCYYPTDRSLHGLTSARDQKKFELKLLRFGIYFETGGKAEAFIGGASLYNSPEDVNTIYLDEGYSRISEINLFDFFEQKARAIPLL